MLNIEQMLILWGKVREVETFSKRAKRPKLSWSGLKLAFAASVTDEENHTVKWLKPNELYFV